MPSDASEFELSHFNYQKYDYTDDWTLIFKSDKDNITYMNGDRPYRHLPKGNYQILCLAKDATEEQAASVVDKPNVGETVYDGWHFDMFNRLMQSLGCEGRYAVLKEVE